jgi:uncharacterized protein YndB with AHSA1/START domain
MSDTSITDVRKTVSVPVSVEQAFTIFVQEPMGWWPEHHVFVTDRQSITIEPRAGGRYYERGADGTEVTWGTIVEWTPNRRIVMTWRVGSGWQPVFDDERASLIQVDFSPDGAGATEVALTHAQLHRHGDAAELIHKSLDGPSPGDTLARYAELVARHVRT